jgi:Protein of unknown function (DUF3293)
LERKTDLSRTLVNSYRVANYRVITSNSASFILKIKKKSSALEALMKKHNLFTAAYITAYNIHGKKTELHINIRAQKNLAGDVRRIGLPFLEGFGEDTTGVWKKEPSFLILGITLEDAEALGVKYGQNAIVWMEDDYAPRLVFLR